jgi:hypothetical protein
VVYLIDTMLDDLGRGGDSSNDPSSDSSWTANNWLLADLAPSRYRMRYTRAFARQCFFCLLTVAWMLGQRSIGDDIA